MFPPPVACASSPESIPPKIQAAFQFLHFCEQVRNNPYGGAVAGDAPRDGRELTSQEKRAYDAALQTIIEYFNDPSPIVSGTAAERPPDDPEQKSPVPV